ncbi:MAG: hypothetical protein LBI42_10460 [Chitinispirillales bacterium]|nr:hypothetical protein [Chitinispirillales bacterium]
MDISFHYFAVKTLAYMAGFSDDEAQRIAEYSQYVDDYNWTSPRKCSKIPRYAKLPQYDLVEKSLLRGNSRRGRGRRSEPGRSGVMGLVDIIINLLEMLPFLGRRFIPVRTGFNGWVNLATIVFNKREQKFVALPFHFLPRDKSIAQEDTRVEARSFNDNSLIDKLLMQAVEEYISRRESDKDTSIALMRIGMLLHTFADTHAHQSFSGYHSWVNDVEVTSVIDNVNNKNITVAALAKISELEHEGAKNIFNSILEEIYETETDAKETIIDNALAKISKTEETAAKDDIINNMLEDLSIIEQKAAKNIIDSMLEEVSEAEREGVKNTLDNMLENIYENETYVNAEETIIGSALAKISEVKHEEDVKEILNRILDDLSVVEHDIAENIIDNMHEEISEPASNAAMKNSMSQQDPKYAALSLIPVFIGHSKAAHVPDRSNISFTMKRRSKKDGARNEIYKRDNTKTFVEASRHIFDYMKKCLDKPQVTDNEWKPLSELLTNALLIEKPEKDTVKILARHWKLHFPKDTLTYHYEEKEVEKKFFAGSTKNMDAAQTKTHTNKYTKSFYRYNCIADEMLIELYGDKPRKTN